MQRQRQKDDYIRQIDFIFYHEREIREAVGEARFRSHSSGAFKIVNGSNMTDPTASQAVENLTPLSEIRLTKNMTVKNPERWLEVVDKTYAWCKRQKDCRFEVARRRYNQEDYRVTCQELVISNSMRRRLLDSVRIYATLQAVQSGLISI